MNGLLVSPLGHRNALHAHAKARRIHHHEHVLEAAVFLADEVADRAASIAVLQHRRGTGLDAQLVLDAHAPYVIARAVLQDLGADEQRNALHAFRRTCHPGQHQVDDVVRHVVLAVGDVDLGAKQTESAIGLRFSSGTYQ